MGTSISSSQNWVLVGNAWLAGLVERSLSTGIGQDIHHLLYSCEEKSSHIKQERAAVGAK